MGTVLEEYAQGPRVDEAPPLPAPGLQIDTRQALPDLQDKAVGNKAFSQKYGIDAIPFLGRAAGGRARIKTQADEALSRYYTEKHGIGPAIASALGEELGGRINAVFKADKEGNLNAGAPIGVSKKISDVFEGLRRNPLTEIENPRGFDTATWQYSVSRGSSAPVSCGGGTYAAAGSVSVGGTGKYLSICAKATSTGRTMAGSLDVGRLRIPFIQ